MSAASLFLYAALSLLIATIPTVTALRLDRRRIDGDNVWAKPLKFELSLAIHFATLAWLAVYLPSDRETGAILESTAIAAAVAALFEMAYIGIQAARQKRSHFNVDTPIEALFYSFMGIGAVVITAAAGVVGVLILSSDTPTMSVGLKTGGGIGLLLGTILTLVTAFRIGGSMNRRNGEENPAATRMPLTGWSTTVADRRIPHFFATHIMQAMPLFGLAGDAALPPIVSVWIVVTFGAAYAVFTLHLFNLINRGRVIDMTRMSFTS